MVREDKHLLPKERSLLEASRPYMDLSKDVYTTHTSEADKRWKVIASSEENPEARLNGFFARVYERTDAHGQPRYAVAFRGTSRMGDIKDLGADFKIALLKLPGQYMEGLKFVEDFCREKNIDPATMAFTGHSLGGYLASTVGQTLNANNIWTFNAPAPGARIASKIGGDKNKPEVPGPGWVQIRSKGDLVSKWGNFKGATTVSVPHVEGHAHGIASLKHAVTAALKGEHPHLAPAPKLSGRKVSDIPKKTLSRAYKAAAVASEKIAASPRTDKVVSRLMGDEARKKPLEPAPA